MPTLPKATSILNLVNEPAPQSQSGHIPVKLPRAPHPYELDPKLVGLSRSTYSLFGHWFTGILIKNEPPGEGWWVWLYDYVGDAWVLATKSHGLSVSQADKAASAFARKMLLEGKRLDAVMESKELATLYHFWRKSRPKGHLLARDQHI